MSSGGTRWLAIAVLITVIAGVWWWSPGAEREDLSRSARPAAGRLLAPEKPRPDDLVGADAAPPAAPEARRAPAPPAAGPGLGDDEPDEFDGDAIAAAWATVDLDAVRRALPDNRYWLEAAPTTDEALIEARAADRRQRNVEYGKVLSGTGTDAEVRAYYDDRARLSGDYVEFATYLLDNYEATLPPRDVALLQLARRMHLSRLEEIPRRMQEALERKQQQDEARAQWLADERAFGAAPSADPPQPSDAAGDH